MKGKSCLQHLHIDSTTKISCTEGVRPQTSSIVTRLLRAVKFASMVLVAYIVHEFIIALCVLNSVQMLHTYRSVDFVWTSITLCLCLKLCMMYVITLAGLNAPPALNPDPADILAWLGFLLFLCFWEINQDD